MHREPYSLSNYFKLLKMMPKEKSYTNGLKRTWKTQKIIYTLTTSHSTRKSVVPNLPITVDK